MAACSDADCSPPWNFSWVVHNELAAMAWPQTPSNLNFLIREGIHHLVTLSPEKKPPIYAFPQLMWTEIKVQEFESPRVDQIHKFINVCQNARGLGEAVGVHCRMGRGRTGVMLACYLVHFCEQTPDHAITNVRLMRPGSVETRSQEKAVTEYYDYICKNRAS